MKTGTIVLLVILAILILAVIGLYFLGKKAQKKQAEQQKQLEAMKQTVSMLIIDKKRLKDKMGELDLNSMNKVDTALSISFGLEI